jgi:hypothetical protein
MRKAHSISLIRTRIAVIVHSTYNITYSGSTAGKIKAGRIVNRFSHAKGFFTFHFSPWRPLPLHQPPIFSLHNNNNTNREPTIIPTGVAASKTAAIAITQQQ